MDEQRLKLDRASFASSVVSFSNEIPSESLGGEQHWPPLGEAAMWVVESGRVELFAGDSHAPESNLLSLGSFSVDDVFFSFDEDSPTENFCLTAKSTKNSSIRKLTADALDRLIHDQKLSISQLRASLLVWIDRVQSALDDNFACLPGSECHVASEKLVLEIVGQHDLEQAGCVWKIVAQFREIVLSAMKTAIAVRPQPEPGQERESRDSVAKKRIAQKSQTIEREFERSIDRIAEIMNDSNAQSPSLDWDDDALLCACHAIGEKIGVQFSGTNTAAPAESLPARVKAIAAVSGVSMRKVTLDDRWWTSESGPLLAFMKTTQEPVALLPRRRGGYRWVGSNNQSGSPVDASVAANMDRDAVMFYPPFPERQLGVIDIVSYGLSQQRGDLIAVLVFGLFGGALGAGVPFLTGIIFDSVIPGAERGQLLQICGLLLASAVAVAMTELSKAIALWRIETKAAQNVQAAVWDRLLRLPAKFFRKFTAGDLTMRAYRIDSIRSIVSGTVLTSLLDAFFSIFYLVLLFVYSVRLALVGVALISVASLIVVGLNLLALKYDRQAKLVSLTTSGRLLEFISGIAKIRMSGTEKSAFAIWAQHFSQQREYEFRGRAISNIATCFSQCFPVLAAAIIFHQFGTSLGTKTIATGHFLAFFAAFTIFLRSMLSLGDGVAAWISVIPLYENAKPILLAVPEVDEQKKRPGELKGAIELNNVSFRYSEAGPLILRDLSFRVEPGEFVAFVGGSGAGKSTVFRMLLGFESPETGNVYFDQQDFSGLDVKAVRQQMGVVLQNGRLMPGNIFFNIVGSASDLTQDDAWQAARQAGLEDDIKAMPMGMQTFVSEGGGGLSGGQCQRLLIARAIAKGPRILLMDEATSALDNRSQEIVSESLDRIHATRIVIAHRLSTIVNADRILVLSQGAIAEQGTYDELMKKDGLFADLARRQIA
jgi:ATP-binding cassette subfamily C protein